MKKVSEETELYSKATVIMQQYVGLAVEEFTNQKISEFWKSNIWRLKLLLEILNNFKIIMDREKKMSYLSNNAYSSLILKLKDCICNIEITLENMNIFKTEFLSELRFIFLKRNNGLDASTLYEGTDWTSLKVIPGDHQLHNLYDMSRDLHTRQPQSELQFQKQKPPSSELRLQKPPSSELRLQKPPFKEKYLKYKEKYLQLKQKY
jgi:hypothetical protein